MYPYLLSGGGNNPTVYVDSKLWFCPSDQSRNNPADFHPYSNNSIISYAYNCHIAGDNLWADAITNLPRLGSGKYNPHLMGDTGCKDKSGWQRFAYQVTSRGANNAYNYGEIHSKNVNILFWDGSVAPVKLWRIEARGNSPAGIPLRTYKP